MGNFSFSQHEFCLTIHWGVLWSQWGNGKAGLLHWTIAVKGTEKENLNLFHIYITVQKFNAGKKMLWSKNAYPSCITIKDAYDWPQIYSQQPQTYSHHDWELSSVLRKWSSGSDGVAATEPWAQHCQACLGWVTWRDKRIWGDLCPHRRYSSRCVKQPTGRLPLKSCVLVNLFWKQRVVPPNIDLI